MKRDNPFLEECEDCTVDVALYALGTLPADKALAVEQRLQSGCPLCLAHAAQYAAVAEHLSLSVAPVTPSAALRHRVLDRVQLHAAAVEKTEHRKVVRGKNQPWIKLPIPGVEMRPLIGEKTFMVRMQPGAVFPKHDHPQAEQCYVIEGSITDSDGLTLHAGDFVVMSSGTEHDPIRSANGCTLLIAYAD
jgi:anti-sigma factor ChrR (cupin superfamily)